MCVANSFAAPVIHPGSHRLRHLVNGLLYRGHKVPLCPNQNGPHRFPPPAPSLINRACPFSMNLFFGNTGGAGKMYTRISRVLRRQKMRLSPRLKAGRPIKICASMRRNPKKIWFSDRAWIGLRRIPVRSVVNAIGFPGFCDDVAPLGPPGGTFFWWVLNTSRYRPSGI